MKMGPCPDKYKLGSPHRPSPSPAPPPPDYVAPRHAIPPPPANRILREGAEPLIPLKRCPFDGDIFIPVDNRHQWSPPDPPAPPEAEDYEDRGRFWRWYGGLYVNAAKRLAAAFVYMITSPANIVRPGWRWNPGWKH